SSSRRSGLRAPPVAEARPSPGRVPAPRRRSRPCLSPSAHGGYLGAPARRSSCAARTTHTYARRMRAEEVREAKRSLVERYGPWRGYNLQLADGVYTMSAGLLGAAELNIGRVLQIVSDHAPKPLTQLRML